MFSAFRLKLGLVLLLCTALLAVRAVDDRLHLCFDGSEPLVSLHAADAELEHGTPNVAGGHHDVDVELFHANLSKGSADPIALLAWACVALVFCLVSIRGLSIPMGSTPAATSHFRYFRPPLRGPPATPA